ncbi:MULTISPECIES: hypothetical protein [unclassified Legionella]|uniref:hypothetical protein n=1 Tax=unclassified Legionella TaxID=2622702 RepID=UPI0010564248|nr:MULTISPECIES: hypothetical protein [unclassified Legionella]MDI9818726.1 hypothetical protein [Legionella sp. PL877]
MTKEKEESKKRAEEEARLAKEKEDFELLEQKKAQNALSASLGEKPSLKKEEEEITFKPAQPGSNWERISDAYELEFGKKPEANGLLKFESMQAAEDFFDKQAKKGLEFFGTVIGADGKPIDSHMFSCGSGKLFNGSLQQIHDQVKSALEKDPQNAKLQNGLTLIQKRMPLAATDKYRQGLRDIKQESSPSLVGEKKEEEEAKSPSPFSTDPADKLRKLKPD